MKEGDFNWGTNRRTGDRTRVVRSTAGKEYWVGTKLGQGGVAKTFHAEEANGKGKQLVFKEYIAKTAKEKTVHMQIRQNIVKLIRDPILDAAGHSLHGFVQPLDIVDLPASGGFGYVMEFVDTKSYLSVDKLWHETKHKDGTVSYDSFPSMDVVCRFCIGILGFFQTVHLRGWCYKDINKDNIYIHPGTGDFYVIDCDNISFAGKNTILGTENFIAPEVYRTETPDRYSDYYSLAAYFFRLLTRQYPMAGPGADRIMYENDLTLPGAAALVYGRRAVFCFNPKDQSNAAYLSPVPFYKEVTSRWLGLPDGIKLLFLKTFVDALPADRRDKRPKEYEWQKAFEDAEKNELITCRRCRCKNFKNAGTCCRCGKKLPAPVPAPTLFPVNNPPAGQTNRVVPQPSAAVKVVFDCVTVVNGKKETKRVMTALDKTVTCRALHPALGDTPCFTAHYLRDRDMYTIKNLSSQSWPLARKLPDGTVKKNVCCPGQEVPIKTGVRILIAENMCYLVVVGRTK